MSTYHHAQHSRVRRERVKRAGIVVESNARAILSQSDYNSWDAIDIVREYCYTRDGAVRIKIDAKRETGMETTGKALVEHWGWAAEKGLMNKNTAAGLRAATGQVLGVLEDWENEDVTKLNVEQTLTRFQNLRRRNFK